MENKSSNEAILDRVEKARSEHEHPEHRESDDVSQEEVDEVAENRTRDIGDLVRQAVTELDSPGSYLKYLTTDANRFNTEGSSVGEEELTRIMQNIEMVEEAASEALKAMEAIRNTDTVDTVDIPIQQTENHEVIE